MEIYIKYNDTSFLAETMNAILLNSFSMPFSYLAKPD